MTDLADLPAAPFRPTEHRAPLQAYWLPTPNRAKVSIMPGRPS